MFPQDPLRYALQAIEYMYAEIEESEGQLMLATTVDDIQRAKRMGKLAVVFCFEGGMPLGNDLSSLGTFYRLGVRCIGLTANLRNQLADGISDRAQGGLSSLGAECVKEMNRQGIVIDVSHLSDAGALDVLDLSHDPVIASHSNAAALCDHPRNLKDDLIRAISQGGGVVGVHALSDFISKSARAKLEDLLNHIDHIIMLAGVDHVGIGPDLLENWPVDLLRQIWAGTPTLIAWQSFLTLPGVLSRAVIRTKRSRRSLVAIFSGFSTRYGREARFRCLQGRNASSYGEVL
jgi:membrane dipeptidase